MATKKKHTSRLRDYAKRNKSLRGMGFSNYEAYLESPLWKRIRTTIIGTSGKCQVCKGKAEVVHHRSYHKSVLEGNLTAPLVCLCHDCHGRIEFTNEGVKRSLAEANQKLDDLIPGGSLSTPLLTTTRQQKKRARRNAKQETMRKRVVLFREQFPAAPVDQVVYWTKAPLGLVRSVDAQRLKVAAREGSLRPPLKRDKPPADKPERRRLEEARRRFPGASPWQLAYAAKVTQSFVVNHPTTPRNTRTGKPIPKKTCSLCDKRKTVKSFFPDHVVCKTCCKISASSKEPQLAVS